MIDQGNLRGDDRRLAERFADEVAPRVTQGVCRVSRFAPPLVFRAHADHALEAALVLMADAAQRPYTNRPLLPELARAAARVAFAPDALDAAHAAARVRQARHFG